MAGSIKFTINYVCSANAVTGELQYRHILPDGSWSSWIPDFTLGVFAIDTQGGTVLNQVLSDVSGNAYDFTYNTTYDFRIKQTCISGIIEYSNISDPIYVNSCVPFEFIVNPAYVDSSYSFTVRIYDNLGGGNPINPNACSITNYLLNISTYDDIVGSVVSVGQFNIPVGDLTPGAPYFDFLITANDLVQPIINSGSEYFLDFSFMYNTGSQIIIVTCPQVSVNVPQCSTYRVYANEWFTIEWRDCNGVYQICSNQSSSGALNPIEFFICSSVQPYGYTCIPAFNKTTSVTGGLTLDYNELYVPGQTAWPLSPSGKPMILYGALIELITEGACSSDYNGTLYDVTTNQVGQSYYIPPTGLSCNTPVCHHP